MACPRVCSNVSIDDHDYSYFSLMYLISAFVRKPGGFDFLERAIKITTKEKVYNIIISDLTRKWSQAEVAGKLFMSVSSLKRKLAAEEVSFSKIYLDARMNQAIKLLRMGLEIFHKSRRCVAMIRLLILSLFLNGILRLHRLALCVR